MDQTIDRLESAVRVSADRITVAAAQRMDGAKEIVASFVTRAICGLACESVEEGRRGRRGRRATIT